MHHYRLLLDRLEVDDVRWSTYDNHRDTSFSFSAYCHLLGMAYVREGEDVPSFT